MEKRIKKVMEKVEKEVKGRTRGEDDGM